MEYVFPELKESEDEKMRAMAIKTVYAPEAQSCIKSWGVNPDDVIAWLEKQGEQKPNDKKYTFNAIPRLLSMIQPTDRAKSYCQKLIDSLEQEGYSTDAKIVRDYLKLMNGEKVAMATMDEQNPAYNVGTMFNVGDWIVNKRCEIAQIKQVKKDTYGTLRYYVEFTNGVKTDPMPCFVDGEFHLWTIQDAKDGDVLAASDDSIFIFKEIVDCGCKHYIALEKDNETINVNDSLKHFWEAARGVKPATKEQCDLLFHRMKEAGYEWDAEKKELKKIEQNPAWSEEDEKVLEMIISDYTAASKSFCGHQGKLDWLKSLKERIKGE